MSERRKGKNKLAYNKETHSIEIVPSHPEQQEGQAHSRKIVCHAEGDRCFGCAHYLGKADECEFKGLEQGITISVELKQLVDEQANDEGLWCETKYASEAYLQLALRQLHAAIEGISPEKCALAVLAGEQP